MCVSKLKPTLAIVCFAPSTIKPSPAQHFIEEDPWRIFRIMAEFVDSFETMSTIGPAVTVFGSARMKPSNAFCRQAEMLGRELVKHNLAVITGIAPGKPTVRSQRRTRVRD